MVYSVYVWCVVSIVMKTTPKKQNRKKLLSSENTYCLLYIIPLVRVHHIF